MIKIVMMVLKNGLYKYKIGVIFIDYRQFLQIKNVNKLI